MSKLALHTSAKTATVVGATGLIGGHLLASLDKHTAYQRVIALSRSKPENLSSYRKVEWQPMPQMDAGQLPGRLPLPTGNDFFSCLGTTIKSAGSAEAFKRIDYGINLSLAKGAIEAGYGQYMLVSSVGSDPRSSFLYSRVKGNLEMQVKALPFWGIHIFQPGLLLGERNENRWGERLATPITKGLNWLTRGALGKYRPIEAEAVAQAMAAAAQRTDGGTFTYTNEELQVLAKAYYDQREQGL